MTTPIQSSMPQPAPDSGMFSHFVRLADKEASEQQHGCPFKPLQPLEAPVTPPPDKSTIEPGVQVSGGDDDLMSQDINATAS